MVMQNVLFFAIHTRREKLDRCRRMKLLRNEKNVPSCLSQNCLCLGRISKVCHQNKTILACNFTHRHHFEVTTERTRMIEQKFFYFHLRPFRGRISLTPNPLRLTLKHLPRLESLPGHHPLKLILLRPRRRLYRLVLSDLFLRHDQKSLQIRNQ